MERGRHLGRRLERAMDLPGGTLAGASILEIEGNRRLVVGGCRGISEYTEDCISLRVPEGRLTVYGSGLEMGCLTEDGATISGALQRIEFS